MLKVHEVSLWNDDIIYVSSCSVSKIWFFFIAEVTQLEDPRLEWLSIQEAMLRDYLHTAQEALEVSIY